MTGGAGKELKSSAALSFWLWAVAVLLSGCGFAHEEKLTGPYRLIATDIDEQMALCYEVDGGAIMRIPETVFAVGWDDNYIVAKQHPNNNRSITQFFYLERAKDSVYADPSTSVSKPLTEAEFLQMKTELGLPNFTRVLKALE